MSGALRKAVREAAAAPLRVLPGFTEFSAWQQSVDASALPGWAVATPSSRHERLDNINTQSHSPLLVVVVKRTGAPEAIEAALDDDADAIAPAVAAAVLQLAQTDCELVETAMRIDRSGAEPIGTLTLQFQITSYS